MPAKKLTLADVAIGIYAREEELTPRQSQVSFLAPSSERYSPEVNEFVNSTMEMIRKYGLWGWCCVEVRARLGPLQGTSRLGACSYSGPDEFKAGGYYEQMVEEAIADLQMQVDELYPLISS